MNKFWRGGDPFIWLTGGALALCLSMIIGLVGVILYNGGGVFWPQDLTLIRLKNGEGVVGKETDRQMIPGTEQQYRLQLKVGNRDAYGLDFRWVDESQIVGWEQALDVVVFERLEWGDAYGFIAGVLRAMRLLRWVLNRGG